MRTFAHIGAVAKCLLTLALASLGWWVPQAGAVAGSPPELVEVDALVSVKASGALLNRRTGTYESRVEVTNTSTRTVYGPMRLVLRDLTAGITLLNPSGTTIEGYFYVDLPLPGDSFAPGQQVTGLVLQFSNPGRKRFNFKPSVLAQRLLLRAPVASPAALPPDADTLVQFTVNAYGGGGAGLAEISLTGLPGPLALRDDGFGGDALAGDGIYTAQAFINTDNRDPDECFTLRAEALSEGVPLASEDSKLCVTGFPIATVAGVPANIIENPEAPGSGVQVYADQVLVQFVPGTPEVEITALAASLLPTAANVVGTIPALGVYQFGFPGPLAPNDFLDMLAALRADGRVASAFPNVILEFAGSPVETPDDPQFGSQYALTKVGLPEAWRVVQAQDRAGGPFAIGIVDSGVAVHPDLPASLSNWECLGTCAEEAVNDVVGHGTHVAGVAAALTGNATGVGGASWGAGVISVRITNGSTLDLTDLYNGIVRARDLGAKIINVGGGKDFGGGCNVLNTVLADTVVVAAAGNQGGTGQYFPASCSGVLGVANSTDADRLYSTSNYGSWVSLAAPGTGILSTVPASATCTPYDGFSYCDASGYKAATGTSFAAPLVSGTAALMLTLNESLTASDIIARLRDSGVSLTERNTNTAGTTTAPLGTPIPRLDACAAVLFANASSVLRFDAAASVAEGATNGTVAGVLVPACDNVTYTLSNNAGGRFSLATSGGQRQIQVANGSAIDYEAAASHNIGVTVQKGTLTATKTLSVAVSNVNEPPTLNPAGPFSLPENSANGTVVGTVTAGDPDAGDSRSFSITAGNTGGAFAINSSTGQITVANTAALDFETTPSFSLTVRATDAGGLTGQNTVTVNLTNVPEGAPGLLFSCGTTDPGGGDLLDRGFYVASFPGSRLDRVELFFGARAAGNFTIQLQARTGGYGGAVLGTAQVVVPLNGSDTEARLASFDFGGINIPSGSTVAFLLTQLAGPTNETFYSVASSEFPLGTPVSPPPCPAVETNGQEPPLSTFRRSGIAVRMFGLP